MENHLELSKGSIRKHLWEIAVPAGTGMFFNTMFNAVDTYFAGRVSTQALAALSISFPVFFIIIALTIGLTRAGSALVSYHLGSKELDKARIVAAQLIVFSIFITLVIMTSGLLLSRPIFMSIGVSGEVLEYAEQYIQTIFLGSAFFVFSSAFNSILLACGNSRALRNILVAEFFLNCLLDPWFLYGGFGLPAMGIAGIALATVVVKALGLIYFIYLAIKDRLLPSVFEAYIPKPQILIRILSQGLPASLDMMTIALGFFTTNYFINRYTSDAVAAYGVCLRIEQVVLLPTIGIAMATLAIVGQNFGAGKLDRVKECLFTAVRTALIIMSIGAVYMFFLPDPLIGLFSSDEDVIRIGGEYLRIAALMSWSYAISSMCLSTLQGLQHPFFALSVGLFRQVIARIPLFYWIAYQTDWNLSAIWWGIFCINWFATLITIGYTWYIINVRLKPV